MSIPYTVVDATEQEPVFQLTVVTVCWNALADLMPTVESVLRQKAKGSISIEHVIVDGASTDGTPEWLAKQLAAGNIERYVSEPDRGIYDAMNKGINLARGEVLAFLNAGDWYADDADLAECVLPICRGETESVAAVSYYYNMPSHPYILPAYNQVFLYSPCSHQAFFTKAAIYREIGGYDSRNYRCSADTDMMYRVYRKIGEPLISEARIAYFVPGGMSDNCGDDFRDEHVNLLWKNWDMVQRMFSRDPGFKVAAEAYILAHCYEFLNWQERHRAVPERLRELQHVCRLLSRQAHSLCARLAFRFLAGAYLPILIEGRPCPAAQARLAKFCLHASHIPVDNEYGITWLPNRPLNIRMFLRSSLRKLLRK